MKKNLIFISTGCLLLCTILCTFLSTLGAEQESGIKNFRSLFASLQQVTGVVPTPAILEYYRNSHSRLPKEGRIDEISSSSLLAIKGLASLFCKELVKVSPQLNNAENMELFNDLSDRFYGRPPTEKEISNVTKLVEGSPNKAFLACTSFGSSIEFLIQ